MTDLSNAVCRWY